jgi:hypothetical protein
MLGAIFTILSFGLAVLLAFRDQRKYTSPPHHDESADSRDDVWMRKFGTELFELLGSLGNQAAEAQGDLRGLRTDVGMLQRSSRETNEELIRLMNALRETFTDSRMMSYGHRSPIQSRLRPFSFHDFVTAHAKSPGQGKDAGKPQSIPRIGLMTAASRQRGYVPPGAYLPSDELTPYRGAGV